MEKIDEVTFSRFQRGGFNFEIAGDKTSHSIMHFDIRIRSEKRRNRQDRKEGALAIKDETQRLDYTGKTVEEKIKQRRRSKDAI